MEGNSTAAESERRQGRSAMGRPGLRKKGNALLSNGLTVEDEILLGEDDSDDEHPGGRLDSDWQHETKDTAAQELKAAAVPNQADRSKLMPAPSVRFSSTGTPASAGTAQILPSAATVQELANSVPEDRSGSG